MALGLRPLGSTNWWTAEELQGLARTNGNEPDVLRHRIQEGHDQHLTLDPQLKYALVDHAEFSRSGEPFVVARCREFEDFSGLLWPTEIHWKFYHQDGSAFRAMDFELAAASTEPTEEFRIVCLLNASALNERTGANIRIRNAPLILTDEKRKTAADGFYRAFPVLDPMPASYAEPRPRSS